MKNIFFKHFSLRGQFKVEKAVKSFSIGERLVFFTFTIIMVITAFSILLGVSNYFTVTKPIKGGTFSEGVIGSPRFINPVLAISDADRDLSTLLFSGLMRAATDGYLSPEIASHYEISPDGLVYTFHIRDDAFFHDGEPITADDVLFTIEKTKDPSIKSPRRAEWEGVKATKIDDKTVEFTLSRPYYPFIENTTIGIIPKHIWNEVSSEEFPFSLQNITPIGSGPFVIKDIKRNKAGVPTSYNLNSFDDYLNFPAHLNEIKILFYKNEADLIQAWLNNEIDSFGGTSPESAKEILEDKDISTLNFNLPRIFGVFFNQNQNSIFSDENIRVALEFGTNKQQILNTVLDGYGKILTGPLPTDVAETELDINFDLEKAKQLIEKSGWKLEDGDEFYSKTIKTKSGTEKTVLGFSLSAPNVPELKSVAQTLEENWKVIGVKVEVKLFELGDLNQNVIRPRNYDALLFGEVIGRNPDLTAFWHSSERTDPGYNIAIYTNTKVDRILEQLRIETDPEIRADLLSSLSSKIDADTPAIFLYSPDYLYLPPSNIKGLKAGFIASPSERFSEIKDWYIETEKIWPIFEKLNPWRKVEIF